MGTQHKSKSKKSDFRRIFGLAGSLPIRPEVFRKKTERHINNNIFSILMINLTKNINKLHLYIDIILMILLVLIFILIIAWLIKGV